ncbi:ABC transporter ATP-binding protein [Streptacidiphilus sp. EB103A]|uniref:ABC transporter ATP-binding protein n=1 Tax=Streptacidiphilus sp. EB103A TaxID=3156275 RepID=UPI00351794D3
MRTSSTRDQATGGSPDESPAPVARLVGAVKTYGSGPGAVRALNGVDVAFGAGAFTAVMGPSGSGKSTLLHCGVGLDRLTEGTALIGGTDLGLLRDRELTLLRRTRVGFVFQAFNLIPSLSARENITLPLDLAGRAPDQGFFDELIGALGLSSRLAHRPSELSGGQQQRVAIARALLGRPDIVFADEPTGNLDSRAGAEVLAFLRHAARERGQSIVMVTHDPVAAGYADRAVFLSDGNLVADLAAPTRESVLAELQQVAS